MKKLRVWPCKDIDFSWSDFVYAARMCFSYDRIRGEKHRYVDESDGTSLLCISVRAAFDVYLTARKWHQGDECIFVGVNVPDMYRIAESHGLCVQGTDIDPITTDVDLLQLKASINPKTRFLVVPHLYGHRRDLRSVVELARNHGLDVVEDCAQAFAGKCWWGTKDATLSLFSFGPMKTATALQGAVAIIRDKGLYEIMTNKLMSYPVQPTWRYFLRVCRFGATKIATHPLIYGSVIRVLQLLGIDHETVIHASTKSASGASFKRWLHARPCTALLRVIERKINNCETDLQSRVKKGSSLVDSVGERVTLVLRNQRPNAFWMVPVLVADVGRFKDEMRRAGFDAITARLVPVNRAEMTGAETLANAVMLPFSPRMSDSELRRIGFVATEYHSKVVKSEGTHSGERRG